MFYKTINSAKFSSARAVLNCLLITAYMATFGSCMTTSETYYSKADTLRNEYLEDITKIYLKDGTVINTGDNTVGLERVSDTVKYLVIWFQDSSKSAVSTDYYTISSKKIPADEIRKIEMKNYTVNVPLTLLVVTGSVVVLGLLAWIASGGIDFGGMKMPADK